MNHTTRNSGQTSLAIVAWLLLAVPAGACADDDTLHLDGWLGAGVLDLDYEEFDSNGFSRDREEGAMPAVSAGLRLGRDAWFAETVLSASSGRVEYANPAVNSETDEDILDWDAVAGRDLPGNGSGRIRLYAGLGYRHWQRDIHSSPGANDGLDETYRWWYGIFGVRGEHNVNERVQVRADLQLTRTLDPSIEVRFAAGYDDATLDLGTANGLRAAVTLQNRVGNGMALFVSPWFEYWKLGRSADAVLTQNGIPAGTVSEPRSETHNIGINAGVRWRLY